MFFASRQKKIEAQVAEYRTRVAECADGFHMAIEQYCRTGDREMLRRDFDQVHHAESQADDIRREVEVSTYSKALFPESRGDRQGGQPGRKRPADDVDTPYRVAGRSPASETHVRRRAG